jgi:hypothetical protein
LNVNEGYRGEQRANMGERGTSARMNFHVFGPYKVQEKVHLSTGRDYINQFRTRHTILLSNDSPKGIVQLHNRKEAFGH